MIKNKDTQKNIDKNKVHYDNVYSNVDIKNILKILEDVDGYLNAATTTEISWVGIYSKGFKDRIRGKTVLELGCGNCVNVAIMAALGAKVMANDISDKSGEIVKALNYSYDFKHDITFINGDFTKSDLEVASLDLVIGKAFLHHLTLELEYDILKKVAQILKHKGEARFFETAVNSKILDELRWAIPMNDRPSKWFQPKAFKHWKDNDPHPPRDNSTAHYHKVGKKIFNNVEISPLGILERFDRILPLSKKQSGKFKRWSLKFEKYFPQAVRSLGARSQVIIYKNPKLMTDV